MPKQIYNEGRVVGLSAYESYVRRKLADDENAQVASEREWLASTLGMGASLLLHVDANTQMTVPSSSYPGLRYCDFPFPKSSKLGAASTILMSFFDGTGDFNLQDAIINASTARSLSGKQVVLTNSPILKRKTSLTLKFTNPSAGSITIDDSKSIDGELTSENFVRCTGIISTNPYNARFDTLVTLPNLVIDSGLAAIKGEQFKLYGANNTVLFYDDGAGHLISEADGNIVATTVYNDDGVTIKSFTNIQPDYSSIGIHGISYNTYLDIYISGKLDFTTRKITISVDSRSTDIKYADYGVTFSSSSATIVSNNITSGNVSVAYSYYTYETNTLWADRVTSYGRLLNNSTSSASPSTPGDTKSRTPIGSLVPLTKYVALTSSNIASLVGGDWTNGPTNWSTEYNTKYYTRSGSSPNYTYAQNTKSSWATAKSQTLYVYQLEDELKQMMDYLKIADAIMIQPGEWAHNDDIASPYKDFKPGDYINNPAILRIYFTNEIKNSFNILLTGFVDKDVVVGESDLTSAIDTASPENGDFLGPAAYPWAAKIIVTTPTELSYYLKNSIRSGSQNVVITQSDDSPEVSIAVKNTIDRGTKEQIEGAVKHSDNTDSQLPTGYTGKNVHVGQSDDLYPEDTKIGVKNLITKKPKTGTTQGGNPELPSGYTGKNIWLAQQNDGAETQIGVKNVITSTKSYLKTNQTEDGGSTEIDLEVGNLIDDGLQINSGVGTKVSKSKTGDKVTYKIETNIQSGLGIGIDVDDNGKLTITNTAAAGRYTNLTRGVDYDIIWYGHFHAGDSGSRVTSWPSSWSSNWTHGDHDYGGSGVRDRGDLILRVQINKKDATSSQIAGNIAGAALSIGTATKTYAILFYGNIASRDWFAIRHAHDIYEDGSGLSYTPYKSKICKIIFKGQYAELNNHSVMKTSGTMTGIWNLDNSDGHKCGRSWEANCAMNHVSAADEADNKDGFVISAVQYADGYNGQMDSAGISYLQVLDHINMDFTVMFTGSF